jgi:hypothetical protein
MDWLVYVFMVVWFFSILLSALSDKPKSNDKDYWNLGENDDVL